MEKFVSLTFSGLSLGAIYTLVALGILILSKATGVVNGGMFGLVALGGYLGYWAVNDLNQPLGVAYLVSVVLMFLVGVGLERLTYAPLRRRPPDAVLLSTLAGGFAIEGLIVLWHGANLRSLDSPLGLKTTSILGAHIPQHSLLIIGATLGVVVLLILLFSHTAFGREVRALADDRDTARLQGIPVNRLSIITFGLSSAIAGLGGVLIAPVTSLTPNMGFTPMLYAFGAAIIGGFGSLGGVALAAMLLGLAQQWGGGYVASSISDAFPFMLILLVLALRPKGLFRGEVVARL